MKLRALSATFVLVGVAALASCGSGGDKLALSGSAKNFTMDPKFADFCATYDKLNIALDDMAKNGSTKEAFAAVLQRSKALVDASPTEIQSAVESNDAILNAMDNAFAKHNYDQKKISADETMKKQVQALYEQPGLAELAAKYADYLVKNCGISTEGK